MGITPRIVPGRRDEVRNRMTDASETEWQMYIEPWEALLRGHKFIQDGVRDNFYATVIHNNIISKEVRFWRKGQEFVRPVFEAVDVKPGMSNVVFYSSGRSDYDDLLQRIELWKHDKPTLATPYYYHALILFALGKYEEFIRCSEHFMHLSRMEVGMASVMNRYYYSMAMIAHRNKLRPALQNLNICLCQQPLMAEFWCLMGDAYYHVAKNFNHAKALYKNAIILGRHRQNDNWPMDLTKYKEYPEKMIESCEKILEHQDTFA
jgi:tetratricopeptide (TPR) repeat protein